MPALSLVDQFLTRHGPLELLLLLLLGTALLVAAVDLLRHGSRRRGTTGPPAPAGAQRAVALLPGQRSGPVGAARD